MKEKLKIIKGLCLTISLSLVFSYYIYEYFKDSNDLITVNNYVSNVKDNYNKSNDIEEYLGVLEIPKIGIKKGFYSLESLQNNVNSNIELLKGSSSPDVKNSRIILAAHSGASYLGYFKNLDQLLLNDELIIYYQNNKYIYYVSDIYEEKKDGSITISSNMNDSILVLTTCSKNKDMQLVVIGKKIT